MYLGTLEIYTKIIQHAHSIIPGIEVTSTSIKWSTFTMVINLCTKPRNQVYNTNIIEDGMDSDDPDTPNSPFSDNEYAYVNTTYNETNSSASIRPDFLRRQSYILPRWTC